MDKKTLYAIVLSAAFILSAFFLKDKETNAQLGITAFGGTITYVDYCCNGLAITVTPVAGSVGGTFFLGWNDLINPTVVYSFYNMYYAQGQYTLGLAAGFATCIRIYDGCEDTYPVTGGTIMKIGTSL